MKTLPTATRGSVGKLFVIGVTAGVRMATSLPEPPLFSKAWFRRRREAPQSSLSASQAAGKREGRDVVGFPPGPYPFSGWRVLLA
jgi:hypothetical protein